MNPGGIAADSQDTDGVLVNKMNTISSNNCGEQLRPRTIKEDVLRAANCRVT